MQCLVLATIKQPLKTLCLPITVSMKESHGTETAPILKYNPQFDGLRCFAVLFVLGYHWLPHTLGIHMSTFWGCAINFFFVLSSYLITMVLFSAREKGLSLGLSKSKVMGVFLLRRTIRIFPAYYFFLLLALLVPTVGGEIWHHPFSYFGYVTNYHIYESGHFHPALAHIWTLAVEEQMYLLWPLIVLFVPNKHLLKTFAFLIICSLVNRFFFYNGASDVGQAILTQNCMDAFAVGALLAYKRQYATEKEKKFLNWFFNAGLIAALVAGPYITYTEDYYFSFVFNRLLSALLSAKIIEGAAGGYKNFVGKVLEWKPIVSFGRMSYGIYLYHLLVPVAFWRLYNSIVHYGKGHYPSFFAQHKAGIETFETVISSGTVCLVIYFVFTLLMAMFSAKFIEQPISHLKVPYHFNFKKTPQFQKFILRLQNKG